MNFDESIAYLYSLGNEVLAMKLGLENIGKLLAELGNPEKNYLKVQIAGTNGKGSTVAFLESICLSAGIRVGATTSPHLVSITERIRICGKEIDREEFARYATLVRAASEKLVANHQRQNGSPASEESEIRNPKSEIALENVPTFFEQVTAIALLAFVDNEIELAILETGLGGRFDATTAAGAQIVGITAIDYDHERILGETLAQIAAEKAAIIRAETKAVVAPQPREAEQVILERCREVGVRPIRVASDYAVKINQNEHELPEFAVNFATANDVYHDIVLGLPGRHQIENALVAVNLIEVLGKSGFPIEKPHVWTGLKNARHRGRLEYADGILFDGAHNAGGARALREFLDEFVKRKIVMIFGALRDKNLAEIAAPIFPKADRLILTQIDNPRSAQAADSLDFLPAGFAPENVFQTAKAAEALKKAREISSADDLILVTGSLYLIGEIQALLENQSGI